MESQSKSDVEQVFREMRDLKSVSMQEEIKDIELLIHKRDVLHAEIFSDIEAVKTMLRNHELDAAMNPGADSKQISEIRKKGIELEELKVQEKLNHWRDVAELKKELREMVKEARDSDNKTNLLNSLME